MEKKLYCCVIHNRRIGAGSWRTFDNSVRKAAIAFCGEVCDNPFTCTDCDETLTIKINADTLNIQFAWIFTEDDGKQIIRPSEQIDIPYQVGKIARYIVPICDAMESWCFMVSCEPIDADIIMDGYRKGHDGVFYNIEDIVENRKRLDDIKTDVKQRGKRPHFVLAIAFAIVLFLVLFSCIMITTS